MVVRIHTTDIVTLLSIIKTVIGRVLNSYLYRFIVAAHLNSRRYLMCWKIRFFVKCR